MSQPTASYLQSFSSAGMLSSCGGKRVMVSEQLPLLLSHECLCLKCPVPGSKKQKCTALTSNSSLKRIVDNQINNLKFSSTSGWYLEQNYVFMVILDILMKSGTLVNTPAVKDNNAFLILYIGLVFVDAVGVW